MLEALSDCLEQLAQQELADEFEVSQPTIHNIINRKTYAYVGNNNNEQG